MDLTFDSLLDNDFRAQVFVALTDERVVDQQLASLLYLLAKAIGVRCFVLVLVENLCLNLRIPLVLSQSLGLLGDPLQCLPRRGRTPALLHQARIVAVGVLLEAVCNAHYDAGHAVEGTVDAMRVKRCLVTRSKANLLVSFAAPHEVQRARRPVV